MSDDDKVVLEDMRFVIEDIESRPFGHPYASPIRASIALIERQAAEIERLRPKKMTRAEALAVLRRHEYRGTASWGETSVGVTRWAEFELFAAAEKLERDAGPIATPLEPDQEGGAS